MWSRSKPSCDMLLTERKQLKSIPGCGGLTSTTWNGVNGVRGLKQKCLPLGGGGYGSLGSYFYPIQNTVILLEPYCGTITEPAL